MTDTLPVHLPRAMWPEFAAAVEVDLSLCLERCRLQHESWNATILACREALEAERRGCRTNHTRYFVDRGAGMTEPWSLSVKFCPDCGTDLRPAPEPTTESGEPEVPFDQNRPISTRDLAAAYQEGYEAAEQMNVNERADEARRVVGEIVERLEALKGQAENYAKWDADSYPEQSASWKHFAERMPNAIAIVREYGGQS